MRIAFAQTNYTNENVDDFFFFSRLNVYLSAKTEEPLSQSNFKALRIQLCFFINLCSVKMMSQEKKIDLVIVNFKVFVNKNALLCSLVYSCVVVSSPYTKNKATNR